MSDFLNHSLNICLVCVYVCVCVSVYLRVCMYVCVLHAVSHGVLEEVRGYPLGVSSPLYQVGPRDGTVSLGGNYLSLLNHFTDLINNLNVKEVVGKKNQQMWRIYLM